VTDCVTGVANAWRANSPILVIGGQGPFANLRRGSLQEMDHVGLMAPITKWSDACYQTGVTGDPPIGFGVLRNLGKQKTANLP
jgi:acetolactate synthase-1/2/3 large subunit